MRCLLVSIIVFFLSCNKQDFCDQDSYPPPPFGNSDDTTFGKTFVQYSYTCFNGTDVNRIYTYNMSEDCWTMQVEEQFNPNCP